MVGKDTGSAREKRESLLGYRWVRIPLFLAIVLSAPIRVLIMLSLLGLGWIGEWLLAHGFTLQTPGRSAMSAILMAGSGILLWLDSKLLDRFIKRRTDAEGLFDWGTNGPARRRRAENARSKS
jgi:hypothetical protein